MQPTVSHQYKHASLCSGIGAAEIAADDMGWENIFHCERERFPAEVLRYHWPNSFHYDDIKTADITRFAGAIDVLTAGFPCQPFSNAGDQLGTEDDRHLWPYVLKRIIEGRPRWFVGENVRGFVTWSDGLVFNQTCTDLENAGYEVAPFLLPACSVNAPHERYRIFIVARRITADARGVGKRSGSKSEGGNAGSREFLEGSEQRGHGYYNGPCRTAANTMRFGTADSSEGFNKSRQLFQKTGWFENKQFYKSIGVAWAITHTEDQRDRGKYEHNTRTTVSQQKQSGGSYQRLSVSAACGVGNIASCGRVQTDGFRESGLIDEKSSFDYWRDFPTQYPVCGRNDGFPGGPHGITLPAWRRETIKAYGNTKVPQLVLQIFKAIEQHDILYGIN